MTIISGTAALAAQINSGLIVATALQPTSTRSNLCNARMGGSDDFFGSVSDKLLYTQIGGGNGSPQLPLVIDCRRRSKSEPPRRLNIEPGVEADFERVGCG